MSSDIAVAGDARIEEKQKEKYQDLRGRVNVTVTHLLFGALGIMTKERTWSC